MEESLSNNDSTDSINAQKSHEYSSPSILRQRRPVSENYGDPDDRPVDAGESSASSSDYNLVRLEFLSSQGFVTWVLSPAPKYTSLPIHLLLAFFKDFPFATRFLSVSQTVNVGVEGLVLRGVMLCLKVAIEPVHGIPEIADAYLLIESELPLFKMLIWSWKKTSFLSIALVVFMTELLFALICQRSVVRVGAGNASSQHTARQVQASKLGFSSA